MYTCIAHTDLVPTILLQCTENQVQYSKDRVCLTVPLSYPYTLPQIFLIVSHLRIFDMDIRCSTLDCNQALIKYSHLLDVHVQVAGV